MRNKFLNKMVSSQNADDQISQQSTKTENEIIEENTQFPLSNNSSSYMTCSNEGSEDDGQPQTGGICSCECPSNPICTLLRIWFFPWTWILSKLIPWGLINGALSRLRCIWHQLYQPVKIGKFGLRWVLRIIIVLMCMVIGIGSSIF